MGAFDCFVILADMRTGSNFLEANLNSFEGLVCHGEAFNPNFIGYPNRTEILGITQAERDRDPVRLMEAIRRQEGVLGGFRFFSDHDPRVLGRVLEDRRCAKIVLTRNPVESYVSRKIAIRTGQWKLTNPVHARTERIRFDAAEFEAHLQGLQDFQLQILHALQRTGQTAFYLDYEDLRDVGVINGIAAFLSIPDRIEALDRKLKKQNPQRIEDKVGNYPQMEAFLAQMDRFNLGRAPNFEPRRGAVIQGWVAAAESPLLYLPLSSGPESVIRDWLSRLDDGLEPVDGFTFKTLRQWKESRPGHRSFSVLRHPLARAHAVFCDHIIGEATGGLAVLRDTLVRNFGLVLPAPGDDDPALHRAAFRTFLMFLKGYLGGQTNLRVDLALASQAAQLQGITQYAPPDMILREERLAEDLAMLLWQIGREDAPEFAAVTDPHAARLARIADNDLQSLAREAYLRDFVTFGFGKWVPAG